MSGRPIFNEAGQVIGIVSSSFYDPESKEMGTGYSFWFHGVEILREWLTYVDSDNMGWIRGWGVSKNNSWHLAGMFGSKQSAEDFQKTLGEEYTVSWGSNKYGTDDFIVGKI